MAVIISPAYAQEEDETPGSEIVVVGSQIAGAKINEALPVTVISRDDITATAAVSGDDLFRSIPQFGDVNFNSQRSEEHTSELQSLMRISYAVLCLKKKTKKN